MQTYQSRFELELKKLVENKVTEYKDQIAAGLGVNDFAAYRQIVGMIAGLDMIDDLCDEANEICRKRESGI